MRRAACQAAAVTARGAACRSVVTRHRPNTVASCFVALTAAPALISAHRSMSNGGPATDPAALAVSRLLSAAALHSAQVVLRDSLEAAPAPPVRDGASVPTGRAPVVVVHDSAMNALAGCVTSGYRLLLMVQQQQQGNDPGVSQAAFLVFDPVTFLSDIERLAAPGATVVLVQNAAFQNETRTYRLRLALQGMGLKVAEHAHLDVCLMTDDAAVPAPVADASVAAEPPVANSGKAPGAGDGTAAGAAAVVTPWVDEAVLDDAERAALRLCAAYRMPMLPRAPAVAAANASQTEVTAAGAKPTTPAADGTVWAPSNLPGGGAAAGGAAAAAGEAIVAAMEGVQRLTPQQARAAQAYLLGCAASPTQTDRDGRAIAAAIDGCATGLTVETPGGSLVYDGPLETCLLNTGVYELGRGVGGSYPVGEVITEAKTLSSLNGVCDIIAYPTPQKRVAVLRRPGAAAAAAEAPLCGGEGAYASDAEAASSAFQLVVEKGCVVDVLGGAPPSFMTLFRLVREAEGGVAVLRELGIGLNRALGPSPGKYVPDVTAFERQWGVHVSLGKRHPLFPKPTDGSGGPEAYDNLKRRDGKYHLDLFLDATRLRTHDGSINVDFTA